MMAGPGVRSGAFLRRFPCICFETNFPSLNVNHKQLE